MTTRVTTIARQKSRFAVMNLQDLTLTLVESFNALADEVQNLNDRQTILEHKLRFAHEQVSDTISKSFILDSVPTAYRLPPTAPLLPTLPIPSLERAKVTCTPASEVRP